MHKIVQHNFPFLQATGQFFEKYDEQLTVRTRNNHNEKWYSSKCSFVKTRFSGHSEI